MRDSGEHFPAFNVAIRHHGVKKSGKADFVDANCGRKSCSRLVLAFVSGSLTHAKRRGTMELSRGVLQPAGSSGRPIARGRTPEGGSS